MVTVIKILCETPEQLDQHLSVIKKQLKKEFKKQFGSDKIKIKFEDNNCYGVHDVKVREYKEDGFKKRRTSKNSKDGRVS